MNKKHEKRLVEQLAAYTISPLDEQKKRQTIALAQMQLKESVITKTPLLLLVLSQAKFVSKPLWLLQLAAVLATWFFGGQFTGIAQAQSFMFVVVPVLTFYTVPEFVKSQIYGMSELEATCKQSPAKMAVAKLFLIGIANVAAILLITFMLNGQGDFWILFSFGLLPFCTINAVTLFAADILRLKTSYALMSVSLLTALAFALGSYAAPLLQEFIVTVSVLSTVLFAVLLMLSLKRMTQRKELYLWN